MTCGNLGHVGLLAECVMPTVNWMQNAVLVHRLAGEIDIATDFSPDHKRHRRYHS